MVLASTLVFERANVFDMVAKCPFSAICELEVTLKAGSRIFRGTPSPMKAQHLLRNELLALFGMLFDLFGAQKWLKTCKKSRFLARKKGAEAHHTHFGHLGGGGAEDVGEHPGASGR